MPLLWCLPAVSAYCLGWTFLVLCLVQVQCLPVVVGYCWAPTLLVLCMQQVQCLLVEFGCCWGWNLLVLSLVQVQCLSAVVGYCWGWTLPVLLPVSRCHFQGLRGEQRLGPSQRVLLPLVQLLVCLPSVCGHCLG